MKKITLLISLVLTFLLTLPTVVSSHPLLPNSIVEYLNKNPDASEQEITQFMEKETPEFAERYKADYVLTLLTRDTNFWDNTFDFMKLGVDHILSGPDHLFFLVSLLLVYVSIHHILKLTTVFTIAHSITIITAGSGIVTLDPRITEPIIAFSIAYVAFTSIFMQKLVKNNFFSEEGKSKIATVFIFGLFHGLGFAGLLKEIHIQSDRYVSSLISFNIGIEVGQMLFVALLIPFILIFRNKSWYNIFVQIIAASITIVGIIWGAQRIIG